MFDNEFEVVIADTDESRSINYNLRYRVYCLETQFEDPKKYKSGLEFDDFDRNSNAVHFLVRSRSSRKWVAAMRLVKGSRDELPTSFW